MPTSAYDLQHARQYGEIIVRQYIYMHFKWGITILKLQNIAYNKWQCFHTCLVEAIPTLLPLQTYNARRLEVVSPARGLY
jgi:hypothetical protein